MRAFCLSVVFALATGLSLPAPGVVLGTPPGPQVMVNTHAAPGACTSVGLLTFPFNADSGGGGNFCFTNNSPETWFNMEVFVESPYIGSLSCGGDAFVNCTVNNFGGFPTLVFWGHNVAQGTSVDIDLTGFNANGLFRGNADETPLPEPTTMALLSSGLGLAVLRWRRGQT